MDDVIMALRNSNIPIPFSSLLQDSFKYLGGKHDEGKQEWTRFCVEVFSARQDRYSKGLAEGCLTCRWRGRCHGDNGKLWLKSKADVPPPLSSCGCIIVSALGFWSLYALDAKDRDIESGVGSCDLSSARRNPSVLGASLLSFLPGGWLPKGRNGRLHWRCCQRTVMAWSSVHPTIISDCRATSV